MAKKVINVQSSTFLRSKVSSFLVSGVMFWNRHMNLCIVWWYADLVYRLKNTRLYMFIYEWWEQAMFIYEWWEQAMFIDCFHSVSHRSRVQQTLEVDFLSESRISLFDLRQYRFWSLVRWPSISCKDHVQVETRTGKKTIPLGLIVDTDQQWQQRIYAQTVRSETGCGLHPRQIQNRLWVWVPSGSAMSARDSNAILHEQCRLWKHSIDH